jgi:hypothetical protein
MLGASEWVRGDGHVLRREADMATNITRRYIADGMIAIRVDDGDEFEVHHSVWNDADSKRSIIAGEIESQRQTRQLFG